MHDSKEASFIASLLEQANIKLNGSDPWDIQVHNEQLYKRVLAHGSMGLGEAYMEGWWDCEQLDEFFHRILRARLDEKVKVSEVMWLAVKSKITNLQSKHRAFQVGEAHYDLNNEFFQAMLGKTMAYTCGYWRDSDNLDDAEEAKLDLICRKLGLKPGMTLLDIGCGWGSLMRHAAKHYGAICTGVTISKEQVALGEKLCEGLPITFKLMDYRDISEQYDRVASVGMFEHVGHKNYQTYLEVARKATKDDGLFLLHTIGSSQGEGNLPDPWINKYIFPNGEIPAMSAIVTPATPLFVIEDLHNFGPYYDKTLMAWHANFEAHWAEFKDRFPAHFYRMWRYYLLCCAGSFRARNNQVWQFVFSPHGVPGGYLRIS